MKPWTLFLPLVFLQGCLNLNPKVQPVHFYALQATAEVDAQFVLKPTCSEVVGILPIQIPNYLKSNKLLLDFTPPEIHYEEYHRWAEPLAEGFGRIITENLSILFPESNFINAPWRQITPKFTLNIILQDFRMSNLNGLQVNAQITFSNAEKILKSQVVSLEVSIALSSPSSYAQALSELGAQIAQEAGMLLL